nr:MAG: hypothetical protein [Molluscum contagiosum virus]
MPIARRCYAGWRKTCVAACAIASWWWSTLALARRCLIRVTGRITGC